MTVPQGVALAYVGIVVFGLLIWLNVWYRRVRSEMTQEERDEEDSEMTIW